MKDGRRRELGRAWHERLPDEITARASGWTVARSHPLQAWPFHVHVHIEEAVMKNNARTSSAASWTGGLRRCLRRMTLVAVAIATVLVGDPSRALAAIYSDSSITASLWCSVRSESVGSTLIHNGKENDGHRDWVIYEWYRYDGARWVSDGFTSWSYNDDVAPAATAGTVVIGGTGPRHWYEYGTNIADPLYRRTKPAGTVVAAKIWFLNGRDGNYYVSWARSHTSALYAESCRVLGEYCNGYICVPSAGRAQITRGDEPATRTTRGAVARPSGHNSTTSGPPARPAAAR
jgi:hypothetical protein